MVAELGGELNVHRIGLLLAHVGYFLLFLAQLLIDKVHRALMEVAAFNSLLIDVRDSLCIFVEGAEAIAYVWIASRPV